MRTSIFGKLFILIIIFTLFIFFLSLGNRNFYNTEKLIGKKTPNFSIELLENEKLVSEKIISTTKYSLINFWASWCSPCRLEHEKLIRLSNSNKINMIGINFKDDKMKALNYLKDFGDPFNYSLRDSDGRHSVEFGIYGIPETLLVNSNSTIVKKFIGPLDEKDYKEILKIIQKK
tara:strand:- start:1435 stop:1959 length:525 start_codon:yes stop_codon:yes gene_type:complete